MIIKKSENQNINKECLLIDGKNYIVYAILFGDSIKLLVDDEDVFSFPFLVSSTEVEIIDNSVSKYWKFTGPFDRDQRCSSRPAMLACEKMLEPFFYEKLVEGNMDAKKEWGLIKAQLDAEAT